MSLLLLSYMSRLAKGINLLLNINCWTQESQPPSRKISLGVRWRENVMAVALQTRSRDTHSTLCFQSRAMNIHETIITQLMLSRGWPWIRVFIYF